MRLPIAAARTVAVVAFAGAFAAACASPATPAPPAPPASAPSLGLVPGNSVAPPLPRDVPASVRALPPLPSCGAEVLFEEDVDITPVPTPPGPTSNATDNRLALDCLIAAWENGTPAQMIIAETSDEADEIYSIYRLPGDGTVLLIVRVLSHTDRTVSWTQRTCRQLSVQEGSLTPADCETETRIH
jgi:hypothetical protein